MDTNLLPFIQCLLLFGGIQSIEVRSENYNKTSQTEYDNLGTKNNDTYLSSSGSEEIPDPSALIIPGYNLPGPIFNNGKPFYVEKDPLTGTINFNSKTHAGRIETAEEYEYIDEEPSTDIFDKSNIDRKDGGYGSHRPNDVNQLSPNFHDFLNLPVKYNSEKYVYPLISSSYANTKIQGNVNNYNHKQYSVTTYKPTVSPMYYTSKTTNSRVANTEITKSSTTAPVPTTTKSPISDTYTATQKPHEITTKNENLLNSPMNHGNYFTTDESEYDYDYYATKDTNYQDYQTTEPSRSVYVTNQPIISSTEKPYSIFDDLFGDYMDAPLEKPKPPSLFSNLPNFDNYNLKDKTTSKPTQKTTQKPFTTIKTAITNPKTTPSPKNSYTTAKNSYTTAKNSYTTVKPTTDKLVTSTTKATFTQTTAKYETTSQRSDIQVSHVYAENDDNNMYEYSDEYDTNYDGEASDVRYNNTKEEYGGGNKTKFELVTPTRNETKNGTYSNFQQNYQPLNQKTPEKNQTRFSASDKTDTNQISWTEFQPVTNTNYNKTSPDVNQISITSENYDYFIDTKPDKTTTKTPTTKVTSMPLGENHPPNRPVINLTQNLKETLNREKVESTTKEYVNVIPTFEKQNGGFSEHKENIYKPPKDNVYNQKTPMHHVPSTSNIHIAPDQDVVSFVVGNHQNVDGGHFVGSAVKEDSFVSNSFRPLYTQPNPSPVVFDQVNYNRPMVLKQTINFGPQPTLNPSASHHNPNLNSLNLNLNPSLAPGFVDGTTTIKIQPIRGAEASLSIGMPADEVKTIPGQVVDEKLDLNEDVEFSKEPGAKIVFPEDDLTTFSPPKGQPNREILSLYSKPMLHQLPADLTPPNEPEVKPIRGNAPGNIHPGNYPGNQHSGNHPGNQHSGNHPGNQHSGNHPGIQHPGHPGGARPPWDPRPGHFYQGRPEYARPPRPHKPEVYKRIDGLPNILPQFRPNAKVSNGHYMDNVGTLNAGYMPRQPLLDRPNNRPIGFFEKLQPPPPPKRILDLRKVSVIEPEAKHDRYRYEERILNVPLKQEHFSSFQNPPKIPVTNRKSAEEDEIATLQMIQAKQSDKLDTIKPNVPPPFKINFQEPTDKPLYVVYPVNSALKLDVLDTDKSETVVIGQRGEQLPLPPSKIGQETPIYEQKPILKPKERNDAPILKPHSRPSNYPIKSDFPYILERPDPSLANNPASTSSEVANNLDTTISSVTYKTKNDFQSNNQWTSIDSEARIVNGNKISNEQISATLKTYTENPIAIAYTPTNPTLFDFNGEKFSTNFGRPLLTEIRPDKTAFENHFSTEKASDGRPDKNSGGKLTQQNHGFGSENKGNYGFSNSEKGGLQNTGFSDGETKGGHNQGFSTTQVRGSVQNAFSNNKGSVHNVNPHGIVSSDDSEFTVSAVMHTHPQVKQKNEPKTVAPITSSVYHSQSGLSNHKLSSDSTHNHKLNLDVDTTHVPTKLDFQAPFHASMSVGSEYQGWSVVSQKPISKTEIDRSDTDLSPTNSPETSSEFDIENFKPQLFGGFKPIYSIPDEKESQTTDSIERQE